MCRCENCGHVYTPYHGTSEELYAEYERHFFHDGAYHDYLADRDVSVKNFRRFADAVRRHRDHGVLLEIGCAYGFFLDVARATWQVKGIDIHEAGVAHARHALGLDVVQGDFLVTEQAACSYDVVAMWDTIEHVRRPSDFIKKVATILKPGGVLALTTGDVGSTMARLRGRRWRLYDPPFHLHYFSRRTITGLLERHGLEVSELRSVGYHRSFRFLLHRVLRYGRPGMSRRLFDVANGLAGLQHSFYVNLFDIMLVVARKPDGRRAL